ncbi:hypothetical protein Cob_v000272 [Colletotrichum orbiculare MAFF 240422]|uniref:Uncharacterized protein n=1 Tax=Colletotrichum orbiculare (strain 104-T / ATCC 96160 / CBS 514.97 / LARS 414 / MAFF 240422) TaxID=1213857 RepID=A0A484G6C7_COLOR|nr:hypothetical protein Cob_v000272 [Colletotrichum orbiculare MAFF 240422]
MRNTEHWKGGGNECMPLCTYQAATPSFDHKALQETAIYAHITGIPPRRHGNECGYSVAPTPGRSNPILWPILCIVVMKELPDSQRIVSRVIPMARMPAYLLGCHIGWSSLGFEHEAPVAKSYPTDQQKATWPAEKCQFPPLWTQSLGVAGFEWLQFGTVLACVYAGRLFLRLPSDRQTGCWL